jgi:hypothetical protein
MATKTETHGSSRREEAPSLALQIAAVKEAAQAVIRSSFNSHRWDTNLEERYYKHLKAAQHSLERIEGLSRDLPVLKSQPGDDEQSKEAVRQTNALFDTLKYFAYHGISVTVKPKPGCTGYSIDLAVDAEVTIEPEEPNKPLRP